MVTVPDRDAPEFAPAWKVTGPLPLPLAPAGIASQAALLVAVQGQPAGLETLTELEPPLGGSDAIVALKL